MAYRYFIELAYNGSAYSGWQLQPNAATVQQFIEESLALTSGINVGVTGCGRTDAGVHASSFFLHFDAEIIFSNDELFKLKFKLNRFLPPDISIIGLRPVVPGAHARYSASWREYEYLVIRNKDPFNYNRAYFVHGDLDVDRMNECAKLLLGRHDFESFSKVHTDVNNFFCHISFAWWQQDSHFLKFNIRSDRFLRNMVRAIVGTLLDVGRGKISTDEFQKIIDSRNRSVAGYSVPAKGLTLKGIGYPDEIFSTEPVYFSPDSSQKIISHYYTDPEFHKGACNKTDE